MRCLIVSCVFPPEPVVSSRTSAQIAETLARAGHDVTVIAPFPSRPAGRLYQGFKRRALQHESHASGYRVVRCFSVPSRTSSMPSRLLENATFGISAALAALFLRRPDVIYANTWPVVATALLSAIARLRRIPVVLSVQDLYPESLVAQGRVSADAQITRAVRAIDVAVARRAAGVIAISSAFGDTYRHDRGVPPERVHEVPNWVDSDDRNVSDNEVRAFRQQYGIADDATLIVYGGNVGVAAHVESAIQAMSQLQSDRRIHLLIAGDGSRIEACRALARQLLVRRVHWYSPWPEHETQLVLRAADILVLPTRAGQAGVSVPSKLIGYMLSGRPIVAAAEQGTPLAEAMKHARAGWIVRPGQPAQLAAALRIAARLPADERAAIGQYGREHALAHYTRAACVPRVVSILEQAAVGQHA